jgi:hypothetical protein
VATVYLNMWNNATVCTCVENVIVCECTCLSTEGYACCTGVGCTRLVLPAGMWARVEGDVTSVYCNATHETWTVHCQDSRWTGLLGNCSLGQ